MKTPQRIESPQNARLKRAARLRERRGRRQQGRTIVDGLREVDQALQSTWNVVEVFARASQFDSDPVKRLRSEAETAQAEWLIVDDPIYEKLCFGERVEPVVAVVETPDLSLSNLTLPPQPLLCVLDRVEKPGNLGAVLRTLDAVGADALVLADPVTDIFNPNAIRASLGAVFRLPIAAANAADVRQFLQQQQLSVFAARVEEAKRYDLVDFCQPAAIVFGSEAEGLDDTWRQPSIQSISIPMHGAIDSLNVSVSAAVVLYEARRQRNL